MQISSMINSPNGLSTENKASESVHNSFWTLKKGFDESWHSVLQFSLGCPREIVCFFLPYYADHFFTTTPTPTKSSNFHILKNSLENEGGKNEARTMMVNGYSSLLL